MSDTLAAEEKEALQHRLAMYQQLVALYPREHKHLQHQIEVLLLLHEYDEAELLLGKVQSLLISNGLEDHAKESDQIRHYLNNAKHHDPLYSTPFLHLASSSFVKKVFRKHRRIDLKEGEYLIRYGEEDTQMFILVHGELAVWSRDDAGNKHFEHSMQAGEVIGELAFLDNTPRSADVIACTPCTLLNIPSQAVLKLFLNNPEVEQALRKEANTRKVQMGIKKNPALAKLPRNLQTILAKHGEFIQVQALVRIYQSGEKVAFIDLICSGYIRLVGEHKDGSSLILNSLKQGSLLGCSAATPHMEQHYIADIVSMSDVTLIRFPIAIFRKVLAANPRLYQAVLQHAELERGSLLQTMQNKAHSK